ncbi:CAP domain-containing protein [Nonomuraea rhodomycinica]|uniref:CAP domain-containing protein n=1 Tax=Nonomuraea rhodomycinica TaxID=1712872 RepID=UPI0028B19DAF|nr:CAP domain-containing protein [Nonomuraea rhodomycinica]
MAALIFPVPATADTAASPAATTASGSAACRVVAAKPFVDAKGLIRGSATRSGCGDRTRLRVRITKDTLGPDRVVKSGSRVLANGTITAGLRCVRTPARYYVQAVEEGGRTSRSRTVSLSCARVTPPTTGGGASTVEEEVVALTNKARTGNGCRPLTHDPKLHLAAERHSAAMAAQGFFDHTAPDGSDPGDRIRAAGFTPVRAWGENIAMGQRTAAQVVQGWLDSPGHRANIMNCTFTHIGVGHAAKGPYWTQDFATH